MAKKEKEGNVNELWYGVTEDDFLNEDFIITEDLIDFNTPSMTLFIQNVNLFRQLIMEKDGLKPVERRILIMMYEAGAYMTSKNDHRPSRKCSKIVGDTMGIHGHGDMSIYGTLVNNGQYWKKAVPWIKPHGNFGNVSTPDDYAHMRYTEALVSHYGYCCFFKDLDKDCLEMIASTTGSDKKEDSEPLALPTRYPNILVNGGFGMASGNLFCIPPYQIEDIVRETKRLLKHPETTSIYMVPDFPTECDIIESEEGIREICETGKGKIKLRSTIEIDQKKNGDWILKIKNVPWMVNFNKITAKLLDLAKTNTIQIKTVEDHSYQVKEYGNIRTKIDYWVILDKSSDPYQIKQKLYKLTPLEKSLSIDFNIVTNDLEVNRPSLRGLLQMWIDSRREYKRRLYNKRLTKLNARILLLEILIYLTNGANINKTMDIIRTHSSDEAVEALMKMQKMNSYQATQILGMGLKVFNKDANAKFKEEYADCKAKVDELMKLIHSNKKIDEIIIEELDELKEWAVPRRCNVIKEGNDKVIADTDHTLIVTKMNLVKKIAYRQESIGKPIGMGAFKNNDFPKLLLTKVNNMETVTFFDMYGRFSAMPVYDIDSTINSHPGTPIYEVAKLNGPIISIMNNFNKESIEFIEKEANTKLSIVSLSANGFIKKTEISEFMGLRNLTNVIYTKVRDNDYIVYADILMERTNVLIYTNSGGYAFIAAKDIPMQSKQSTGLSCIKLNANDECAGLTAVGSKDTHLIIVTEKGLVKRVETEYLGTAGKRNVSSYLSSIDEGDKIIWVGATNVDKESKLCVFSRTEYVELDITDIPVQTRKAKGKKMINVPLGSNLIDIKVK